MFPAVAALAVEAVESGFLVDAANVVATLVGPPALAYGGYRIAHARDPDPQAEAQQQAYLARAREINRNRTVRSGSNPGVCSGWPKHPSFPVH